MAKISLKVNIAGRTYPLTVEENEQESVSTAVDSINNAIDSLKKNYAVNDPQDLIAMTALQLIMKKEAHQKSSVSSKEESSNNLGQIDKALEELCQQIDDANKIS
ncbi:MAG: cell division protein ZapA [Crocinitomicaceae bacterium]|jgi:cell division protein ZapA|tara:strand:+ start:43155 stop:43469 length:315 start_codon:yes stop_codon:yes gene_type:complete